MSGERLEEVETCPVRGQACECMAGSVVHRECLARAEEWLARGPSGGVKGARQLANRIYASRLEP